MYKHGYITFCKQMEVGLYLPVYSRSFRGGNTIFFALAFIVFCDQTLQMETAYQGCHNYVRQKGMRRRGRLCLRWWDCMERDNRRTELEGEDWRMVARDRGQWSSHCWRFNWNNMSEITFLSTRWLILTSFTMIVVLCAAVYRIMESSVEPVCKGLLIAFFSRCLLSQLEVINHSTKICESCRTCVRVCVRVCEFVNSWSASEV